MEIAIRPAKPEDAGQIAEIVFQAESSGGEKTAYGQMFGLAPHELKRLLAEIAAEDFAGQELTWPNFMIAEADGAFAGGCAAWIEGGENLPSAIQKANLLSYFLGVDKWKAAYPALQLLAEAEIARTEGALQLESFYIPAAYRGNAITSKLIAAQEAKHVREAEQRPTKAEILLLAENDAARRAYLKAGFQKEEEKVCPQPEILNYWSGRARLKMSKHY